MLRDKALPLDGTDSAAPPQHGSSAINAGPAGVRGSRRRLGHRQYALHNVGYVHAACCWSRRGERGRGSATQLPASAVLSWPRSHGCAFLRAASRPYLPTTLPANHEVDPTEAQQDLPSPTDLSLVLPAAAAAPADGGGAGQVGGPDQEDGVRRVSWRKVLESRIPRGGELDRWLGQRRRSSGDGCCCSGTEVRQPFLHQRRRERVAELVPPPPPPLPRGPLATGMPRQQVCSPACFRRRSWCRSSRNRRGAS